MTFDLKEVWQTCCFDSVVEKQNEKRYPKHLYFSDYEYSVAIEVQALLQALITSVPNKGFALP